MGKFIDLTGQKFNRLTVLKRVSNSKSGNVRWLCKCDCGQTKVIEGRLLKNNSIKSCGCLNRELTKVRSTKHGKHNTRLYGIYYNMKRRCYSKKDKKYPIYGGKGIRICNDWLENFMNFYNWAILNGYADNLTIDRIDGTKNYEPNNCRWITIKEQNNNLKSNHIINFNNKILTMSQWSEELQIPYNFLSNRIRKGKKLNEILEEWSAK